MQEVVEGLPQRERTGRRRRSEAEQKLAADELPTGAKASQSTETEQTAAGLLPEEPQGVMGSVIDEPTGVSERMCFECKCDAREEVEESYVLWSSDMSQSCEYHWSAWRPLLTRRDTPQI